MGKRLGVVVFSVVLLTGPVIASAASSWAGGATYGEKIGGKLKFGLRNVLAGWTEIFTQPVDSSKAGENVLVGVGRGVWNAVGQTVGGAAHTVTFFIPQIDVPLPEGGTNLLQ